MKIVICGFMGAGKSTLLKKLEFNSYSFSFFDLDTALALDFNVAPERLGEWIEQNGLDVFRKKEREKIDQILQENDKLVLALGGGALSRDLVKTLKIDPDCFLIFLDVSFEVCFKRIHNDLNRPLAKKSREELKALFDERRQIYLQSDLILSEAEIKGIEGLETLVHNLFKL